MNTAEADQALTLAEKDLDSLTPYGHEHTVKRGEALWQAGHHPDTLFLIRSGKANIRVTTGEGREAIVQYCARGQMFCMAASVIGNPYPCAAYAATDLSVLSIPRTRFLDRFKRLPAFAKRFVEQMANQVCNSHTQAATSTATVKKRLADLLTRLNKDYEGEMLPFTRQELGSMTGTTTESTIRALSQWEKLGVIRTDHGHIQVRRLEVLEDARL